MQAGDRPQDENKKRGSVPSAMPRLGMGTWHMGEDARGRKAEVAALKLGLDLGMTLIDTAEMYGAGGAEEVVGEAIRGRDDVYVVTKFYPHHASRAQLPKACEASLRRLGRERIDLYLLHWRGGVPLAETLDALEKLVAGGRIARWGVSNFDLADLEELAEVKGGKHVSANQVLYHLGSRGIEYDVLPWCRERAVDVMAYCPLDQGSLPRHPAVVAAAKRAGVLPAQLAIAWLLQRPGVVVIPKASRQEHVRANAACTDIRLDAAILAELDRAFPPPKRKKRLEII
jgi:diketogulonate reductase-like aldo/keto reductase